MSEKVSIVNSNHLYNLSYYMLYNTLNSMESNQVKMPLGASKQVMLTFTVAHQNLLCVSLMSNKYFKCIPFLIKHFKKLFFPKG